MNFSDALHELTAACWVKLFLVKFLFLSFFGAKAIIINSELKLCFSCFEVVELYVIIRPPNITNDYRPQQLIYYFKTIRLFSS